MIEEAAKFILIILLAILLLHIIAQGNGMAWIKSKFQVA